MEETITLISTIGFPIVMCLLLFYQMQTENAKNRETIDTIKEAINQNTIAINALRESLNK